MTLATVGNDLIREDTLAKTFTYLTGLMNTSHDATSHFQVYYSITRTSWNHLQNGERFLIVMLSNHLCH